MEINFPNVVGLEATSKPIRTKQGDNWVDTDKEKPLFVFYPYGQSSKWGTIVAEVREEDVAKIVPLCGKRCSVTVDMKEGKQGNYYQFISARAAVVPAEEKKAA